MSDSISGVIKAF